MPKKKKMFDEKFAYIAKLLKLILFPLIIKRKIFTVKLSINQQLQSDELT